MKKTTENVNPHQTPVLVVDHHLYDIFVEDKFVIMLGGLQIEMALWSTMVDLLRESRWPESFKKKIGLVKTEAAAAAFQSTRN